MSHEISGQKWSHNHQHILFIVMLSIAPRRAPARVSYIVYRAACIALKFHFSLLHKIFRFSSFHSSTVYQWNPLNGTQNTNAFTMHGNGNGQKNEKKSLWSVKKKSEKWKLLDRRKKYNTQTVPMDQTGNISQYKFVAMHTAHYIFVSLRKDSILYCCWEAEKLLINCIIDKIITCVWLRHFPSTTREEIRKKKYFTKLGISKYRQIQEQKFEFHPEWLRKYER